MAINLAKVMKSALATVAACFSLAQLGPYVSHTNAQTVAVQNGTQQGHGWMFAEDGACYLILPRHLAEPLGRMRIRTAAPVAEGTAFGRTPFWPEIDLAIATVDPSLRPRCTGELADLDLPGALRDTRSAQLERLSGAGEVERAPLTIGNRTYLTFDGVVPEGTRVARGTSGSFAFVQGRPLGMVITADGEQQAKFIRSGEIRIHVARWLEEHGRPFSAPAPATAATATTSEADLPIRFVNSSVLPLQDDFAGSNLTLDDGIFVAEPQGGISLTFRLGNGTAAVPLAQVLIQAPSGIGFATPRDLLIEFSAREDGLSMRPFARGQMGLDGAYATARQAPQNARWLRVRVLNAWDAGPVALGRVRAR
jgi:hypothetical protein